MKHYQPSSLALLDAGGVKSPVPSKMSLELAKGHNPLVTNNISDFNKVAAYVFCEPPYIPEPVKNVMATQAVEHRAMNNQIFTVVHPQIEMLQPLLGSIKAPVLIIWGDHDQVIDPSSVGVFQQGLTGAPSVTTVTLKNFGHLPMTEKPEQMAEAYLKFLQNSARRSK
ncbi:MAG: alpha/beta fold hydrolase [Ignavibacteriales bacterium]